MIKYLCEHTEAACYIVTQIEDARGTRADELGVVFRKYTDKPVRVIGSVKDAFEYAVSSRRGGNVYCLGSLYLTGMIEGYLGSRETRFGEVDKMLDYEEELKKFKPSLEVDDIEMRFIRKT